MIQREVVPKVELLIQGEVMDWREMKVSRLERRVGRCFHY